MTSVAIVVAALAVASRAPSGTDTAAPLVNVDPTSTHRTTPPPSVGTVVSRTVTARPYGSPRTWPDGGWRLLRSAGWMAGTAPAGSGPGTMVQMRVGSMRASRSMLVAVTAGALALATLADR